MAGFIYGSVCSGIEAAAVAWGPLGWRPAWFAEIDRFCNALLAHRYPEVKNYGDFTAIGAGAGPIDLLCGGTPCQDFSVAGLRAGLAGERGNLTLEFLKLAGRLRPCWLVWENVPGVLSIDGGRAFGTFLGGLAELGYGFAYRVLDAQHFGVPQRRRRVFVVGYLGDWRPAAAVLFEFQSFSGDTPPRRKTRQGVAPTISVRTKGGGGLGTDFDCDGGLIAFDTTQVTSVANRSNPKPGDSCHPLAAGAHPPAIAFSCKDHGADAGDIAPTLRAMGHDGSHANAGGQVAIALALRGREGGATAELGGEVSNALRSSQGGGDKAHVLTQMAVRRLTPREAERLMGFHDDYTLIPYRGKPAADGCRYKSLGNSMAVPVMRWIGERIQAAQFQYRKRGASLR
jgi:DNA (cytosine-5)-methyltransferase 1